MKKNIVILEIEVYNLLKKKSDSYNEILENKNTLNVPVRFDSFDTFFGIKNNLVLVDRDKLIDDMARELAYFREENVNLFNKNNRIIEENIKIKSQMSKIKENFIVKTLGKLWDK